MVISEVINLDPWLGSSSCGVYSLVVLQKLVSVCSCRSPCPMCNYTSHCRYACSSFAVSCPLSFLCVPGILQSQPALNFLCLSTRPSNLTTTLHELRWQSVTGVVHCLINNSLGCPLESLFSQWHQMTTDTNKGECLMIASPCCILVNSFLCKGWTIHSLRGKGAWMIFFLNFHRKKKQLLTFQNQNIISF